MAIGRGYSVAEAAKRLDHSEATVRRDIERGVLLVVEGAKPLLLTDKSVDAAVDAKLERMGIERDRQPDPGVQAARIAALEAEIAQVRGALADLTAAHSNVMDTYRRLSDGAIPNN